MVQLNAFSENSNSPKRTAAPLTRQSDKRRRVTFFGKTQLGTICPGSETEFKATWLTSNNRRSPYYVQGLILRRVISRISNDSMLNWDKWRAGLTEKSQETGISMTARGIASSTVGEHFF